MPRLLLVLYAAVASLCLLGSPSWAAETPGTVQLPLPDYQALLAAGQSPEAPLNHVLGQSDVTVRVDEDGHGAEVTATVTVSILKGAPTWVPLLPPGVAMSSAREGSSALALQPTPRGLLWHTEASGTHALTLVYRADVRASASGFHAAVPLPLAPSANLEVDVPAAGAEVSVVPGALRTTTSRGDRTILKATIPAAAAVQVAWHARALHGVTISRAAYVGQGTDDAVTWTATFDVDVGGDRPQIVELIPADVALVGVRVDGGGVPISVSNGKFAARVDAGAQRAVVATFTTPIARGDGPPQVQLRMPRVPVSHVTLTLPGDKDVSVTPEAAVVRRVERGRTVSDVHVPLTDQVTLQWSEAVPEALVAEVRANATLVHHAHAEEGVLYARAAALFDITRGETRELAFDVPADVVINQVAASTGGVADWRVDDSGRVLTVFLDRMVSGEFGVDVDYERQLATAAEGEDPPAVPMPLLWARDVNRQRGMVALLASKDLALAPRAEVGVSRVGENQLPAFVRNRIEMTVAHTFKYLERDPGLTVAPATPEREDGRFDAVVDTLVSLGEVTMTGSASIAIDVKSGLLETLTLSLPSGVNLLSLSAPSLRDHTLSAGPSGDQEILVEFTQDMDGQFRVDVDYERIMGDAAGEVPVPTLGVRGAEVEQGRIAVEALTAVEVSASTVENLSFVDAGELPQQLILRTTNPILLAYKYVQVTPPYALGLTITRHREIEVQAAAIDGARYQTLYTDDGLAVTTATFTMRNSREQFLRVALPAGAEVWSATVDGRAEKPALASGSDDTEPEVLVKIINSAQPFDVEVVYAVPVASLGAFGRVAAFLPRPDMVVTRTRWSVFLPESMTWGTPETDMELVSFGGPVQADALEAAAHASASGLRVTVPTEGVEFVFDKLYANQSGDDVGFSIPYASAEGWWLAWWLAFAGAALVWGTLAIRAGWVALPHAWSNVAGPVGGVLLLLTLGYLELGHAGAVVATVLFWVAVAAWGVRALAPGPSAAGA